MQHRWVTCQGCTSASWRQMSPFRYILGIAFFVKFSHPHQAKCLALYHGGEPPRELCIEPNAGGECFSAKKVWFCIRFGQARVAPTASSASPTGPALQFLKVLVSISRIRATLDLVTAAATLVPVYICKISTIIWELKFLDFFPWSRW